VGHEQSKAAKRRYNSGAFHARYFVGVGMDIGGKPDPLSQYAHIFARLRRADVWDIEDGDAQFMAGVRDAKYDFVHSSHCLEHMEDVEEALRNWLRIVKPGGHVIVTVPDEDMYERGVWPSTSNPDHKWTFTMQKTESWSPRSVNVMELLVGLADIAEVEKVEVQRDFFHPEIVPHFDLDQSLTLVTEFSIEFIFCKR